MSGAYGGLEVSKVEGYPVLVLGERCNHTYTCIGSMANEGL